MNALISNLLSCLLFIHAVLGCCWHHAHDCASCGTAFYRAGGSHSKCCHAHRHTDTNREQPDDKRPCEMECSGTCQFVSTKKVEVEPPSWTATDFMADSMQPVFAGLAFLRQGWEPLRESTVAREAVRLHLLHQILLI